MNAGNHTGPDSPTNTATRTRRWNALAPVVVVLAIIATACADGNYVYYIANWSDPTSSSLAVYINNTLHATYPAGSGSGSGNPALTSPCNKYTGSSDGNGGGHLPGYESASWVALAYDSPAPAWEDNHNFGGSTSAVLNLSDADAFGGDFDCATNGGSILRDGLYIHKDFSGGGNFVTWGCIMISQANIVDLRDVFLNGWFGTPGNSYTHTAEVF